MKIIAVTLGLALLPGPALAAPHITDRGVGSLRVGMSTAQASEKGWIAPDPSGCNYGWRMAKYPKALYAGVWDDSVKVVATTSRTFATPKGVRVGDPITRLKRKYPSIRIANRNIYDDAPIYAVPGKTLYFTVRKSTVRMIEAAKGFVPDGTEFEC